jgi:hypothetical protein
LAVSFQEDSLLRLDIAGEKLMINIEPAVRISNYIFGNFKRYCNSIVKNARAKINE